MCDVMIVTVGSKTTLTHRGLVSLCILRNRVETQSVKVIAE
jgi:hypothetical protein